MAVQFKLSKIFAYKTFKNLLSFEVQSPGSGFFCQNRILIPALKDVEEVYGTPQMSEDELPSPTAPRNDIIVKEENIFQKYPKPIYLIF